MLRNFRKEMEDTRCEVAAAMAETVPSKEFRAAVILAVIHLGLVESKIHKTTNLEERRTRINEFNRVKNAIEKGIGLLQNNQPGRRLLPENQKKSLP
ncbi:hypothetical protein TRIP_B350134 [uncultured Desulfatiglans sp.]|uniref:Uncharacterized protein n=1 Tax=Uncultured Desulfatiglans sp. TaxID=1748965 RepID=A0A653AA68_UNCDX|nr:hypothetical protein TRIP_B350134 [uncultured Desulfatiglans sp.]